MDKVTFNYRDFAEIFGDECKIELIDGEIFIGGKPFDEIVETYLRIKVVLCQDLAQNKMRNFSP